MLKAIIRIFAVLGFIVTLVVAMGIALAIHQQQESQREPENVVLSLDLDQVIVEQNEQSPLSLAIHEDVTPLFDILNAIDRAQNDPHVKGIIARFGTSQPSFAQSQEIRAAIKRFRESKKFTYAFASSYGSFGLGSRAYYVASAFENIWLQPVGSVSLTGVAVESPFAKKALDKIGVKADFMQREEYKSFMEMAERDDFSPPVRDMTQKMINDLSGQISAGIAESRKWDKARVERLMAKGPYTDIEAEAAGLVTHIGYEDELAKEATDKAGVDAKVVNLEDYLSFGGSGKTVKPKAKVALIFGTGLIMDKAGSNGGISGEHIMGADAIVEAFNSAVNDKKVKAILFRIDSPGGSPEASESIRRALIHAKDKGKPVVVSMGDVAASGGYWVAMNADHIVANPGTLTGSIGVLAGKFVLGGLMEKIGISFGNLKTTDNAGMWSTQSEFSPAQRERVNALLDQTYRAFIKNVSEARKISMEKMPDVAKGRVWTGAQALNIGLVDELGGYDVAMAAVRKKINLGATDVIALDVYPRPETPVERVLKLLKGLGVESAMVRSLFSQWQDIQAVSGISANDFAGYHSMSARMPNAALSAVR